MAELGSPLEIGRDQWRPTWSTLLAPWKSWGLWMSLLKLLPPLPVTLSTEDGWMGHSHHDSRKLHVRQ